MQMTKSKSCSALVGLLGLVALAVLAGCSGDEAGDITGGMFEAEVAPILDAHCASCHGAIGPYAGLSLGPSSELSSDEILAGILGVPSAELPAMAIIEPGDAENSFLYRKITATHAELACPMNCGNAMPPAGATLSEADIATVRAWIDSGLASGLDSETEVD